MVDKFLIFSILAAMSSFAFMALAFYFFVTIDVRYVANIVFIVLMTFAVSSVALVFYLCKFIRDPVEPTQEP